MTRRILFHAGLIVALALACAAPGVGQAPTITNANGYLDDTFYSPGTASVTAGATGAAIRVIGSGFVPGTERLETGTRIVWISSTGNCALGCPLYSQFVTSGEVWTFAPASLIAVADPGSKVAVENYPYGGSFRSAARAFPVTPGMEKSASMPNGAIGAAYSAPLFSHGTRPVQYALKSGSYPPGLSPDSAGNLKGTPTTTGAYNFTIDIQDAWTTFLQNASYTVTITTAQAAIGFLPETLPAGVVDTPYLQTQLTGTGGSAPYTFAVTGGQLPPGLTLASNGIITGTPTSQGSFTATIQVTAANQATGTGQRTITISPSTATLGFTPSSLPDGRAGVAYSQKFAGVNGTAPYTFVLEEGTLPADLTLAEDGTISGTPVTAGTYSFVVRVWDSRERSATGTVSLVIQPNTGTLSFTPTTLPAGVLNARYSATLTGSGGTAPYTFSITSGSLPPGLALASSGTISGTPTQYGTYTFRIRVVDAAEAFGSAETSISISPGVEILSSELPGAEEGQAYTAQLYATGGQLPYIWLLSSGRLPSGLVLNAGTGIISGTVGDDASSAAFTVTVRDATGSSATRAFAIAVTVRPPRITTTDLPVATATRPYSHTLNAVNGSGTLRWTLAGDGPAWLALSPAGVLSGTPEAAGDYRFGVSVTDSASRSASANLLLRVNPAPLTITTPPLPVTQGGTISIAFAATGGTPPYTWSMGGGTLPPGLSLSGGGTLGGRTLAIGTFDFTVVVTDSKNVTASRAYSLRLTAAPLVITTQSLPSGTMGLEYSTALALEGGTAPYQWSGTGLPPGLTIAADTGAITGTPSEDGTFRVILRATESAGGSATATLDLRIVPPALIIETESLPAAAVGTRFSVTLAASGGVKPYNWLIAGGALPAGLLLSSDGTLSGTPQTGGVARITVTVSDFRGTVVQRTYIFETVSRPLSITTQSLPAGTVGLAYSQNVAAAGGVPPYTWSGTLPAGLTINPSTGAITGAPTTPGPAGVSVTVTDSAGASSSSTYSVNLALPALPSVSIAGPADTTEPLRQSGVQMSFGSAFPVAVSGTLTLTFRADTGGDDASVQFSSGGRTANFTIPANSTQAAFTVPNLGLQVGTVAGVITLTARLQIGGVDVTPSPPPTRTVRVNPGPPVIVSVRATRSTSGFEVQITGYSSTREITQAQFRFTAGSGASLQTSELTIPVQPLFTTWYQSANSVTFGGQFLFTQTFNVQGSAADVQSLTVTLSNGLGASQPATATLQ